MNRGFIGVIVIVIFFAGTWYLINPNRSVQPPTQEKIDAATQDQEEVAPSQPQQQAQDENANWNTFVHTRDGYTFKYPNTVSAPKILPEEADAPLDQLLFPNWRNSALIEKPLPESISFHILPGTTEAAIDSIFSAPNPKMGQKIKEKSTFIDTTINGLKAKIILNGETDISAKIYIIELNPHPSDPQMLIIMGFRSSTLIDAIASTVSRL